MATVALFRISCKKAKDRKRTSVMTQMKYCKQEMLVIETTGVLMEVKTVKLWMYSAGRDISISNGVNVRCEKKNVFVLCFGGFIYLFIYFQAKHLEEWSYFLLRCGIPKQVQGETLRSAVYLEMSIKYPGRNVEYITNLP